MAEIARPTQSHGTQQGSRMASFASKVGWALFPCFSEESVTRASNSCAKPILAWCTKMSVCPPVTFERWAGRKGWVSHTQKRVSRTARAFFIHLREAFFFTPFLLLLLLFFLFLFAGAVTFFFFNVISPNFACLGMELAIFAADGVTTIFRGGGRLRYVQGHQWQCRLDMLANHPRALPTGAGFWDPAQPDPEQRACSAPVPENELPNRAARNRFQADVATRSRAVTGYKLDYGVWPKALTKKKNKNVKLQFSFSKSSKNPGRTPPWFEFLVIFDFFAPWYRRNGEASSVKIS